MSRLSFVLVLVVGVLAGCLGALLLRPQPAPLDADGVRGLVAAMLQKAPANAPSAVPLDANQVNKLVESYLMSDPTILSRMNARLAEEKRVAERRAQKDELD